MAGDDRREWGKVEPTPFESQSLGEAFKLALPYIRALLAIWVLVVLALNITLWADAMTVTRWPMAIICIFLTWVAHDLGNRGMNITFLLFFTAALVTAFWT